MAEDASTDRTRSKVGRVVAEYGLDGLGDELERRWTAPDDERESLRALAERVNRRILEAAMRDAGRTPTPAEVEAAYEALAGDDADAAARTRQRRGLERDGVDVDRLLDDFVTHQAVHTYLTEVRDASYEDEPTTVESERQTIARLRNRTAAVTESTLERLVASDRLADRDYEPLVDVGVLCRDCGRVTDVEALLEDGGCNCDPDDAS